MKLSSWNQFQWMHGTDQRTGFNFDTTRYFGSRFGILSVICSATGSCPTTGVSTDYINNTVEAVPGPSGASTKALKLAFRGQNPNACCQQTGLNSSDFTAPVRDYYMRAWWKFNPDLQAQADSQGSSYWRQVWVFKTTQDQRVDIKLYNRQAGGVNWHIRADDTGANCNPCNQVPYWTFDSTVKAPTTRWFPVEIYFHRANDSTGRFFFAADGQTIIDRRGPNMGYRQDVIAAIAHPLVYSSFKTAGWHMVDSFEVRDRPPCSVLPCGAAE
jgi:hypothetical protein